MFGNQPSIVPQLVQLAIAAVLLVSWWFYYRGPVSRWAATNPRGVFPFVGLVGMLVLTALAGLYVTNELAFRSSEQRRPTVNGPVQQDQRGAVIVNPAPSSPAKTLDQKEQEMIEQNRRENEAAKKAFSTLPKLEQKSESTK